MHKVSKFTSKTTKGQKKNQIQKKKTTTKITFDLTLTTPKENLGMGHSYELKRTQIYVFFVEISASKKHHL
jgi:hypothetical protein